MASSALNVQTCLHEAVARKYLHGFPRPDNVSKQQIQTNLFVTRLESNMYDNSRKPCQVSKSTTLMSFVENKCVKGIIFKGDTTVE